MTSTQPQPGGTLVAVAALHVFLASHPELDALPITWIVNWAAPDRISGMLPSGHPNSAEICHRIAELLDGTCEAGMPRTTEGLIRQPYFVRGQLSGQPVFLSAIDVTPEQAGDES